MGRQLVVAAHVLDGEKIILGRHLGNRDQLHPVLAAVRGVEQQVAEVAGALTLAQRLFQLLDVVLILHRVGDMHDEAGMAAVLVILAAEQRGRLVQPSFRT